MSKSRSFIPRPGNAARPVFFFLLVAFGIMLVGFPILTYAVGLGTGSIVAITLLILAVAVGILWFTVRLGQKLQQDEERLEAGDVWAEWTVSPLEHRTFLRDERRSTNRLAIAYALGGAVLGLVLAWLENDVLLGGIMIGGFLIAGLMTFFFGGPPRRAVSDDARHVRIGPSGVHHLGRYMPFETTMTRLRRVEIDDGDPATMRFTVKAGRRVDVVKVPVPSHQLQQAEALAERLRREHDLPRG